MIAKSHIRDIMDIRRSGRYVLDWANLPAPLRAEAEVRTESLLVPDRKERIIAELRIGSMVDVSESDIPHAVDSVSNILHEYLYSGVLSSLSVIEHLVNFGTREEVLKAIANLRSDIES